MLISPRCVVIAHYGSIGDVDLLRGNTKSDCERSLCMGDNPMYSNLSSWKKFGGLTKSKSATCGDYGGIKRICNTCKWSTI